MNDTPREPHEASDGEPERSILGSLPRSRPSVRSPRRDAAARARKAKPRASQPKASRPVGKRGPEEPKADPTPKAAGEGGVEDIARAGVGTAVQVATAGLRFAGKAAGAIRESLERR